MTNDLPLFRGIVPELSVPVAQPAPASPESALPRGQRPPMIRPVGTDDEAVSAARGFVRPRTMLPPGDEGFTLNGRKARY